MYYVDLILAIVMELIGTNLMKLSAGFSKLWYSVGTIIAYIFCFFLLIFITKRHKIKYCICNLGRCRNCSSSTCFILYLS